MSRPNPADLMFQTFRKILIEPARQRLKFSEMVECSSWVENSKKCLKAKGFTEKVKLAHKFYEDFRSAEDETFNENYANEINFKNEKKSEEKRELGNDHFCSNCYICAIETYTKSLAYAPVNSLQTAKAYGNRSAALIEAGMFRECIEDINRAFDSGYPKQDSYKLLMRKAVCHYWLRELSAMTLVIKEMLEISDKMKREEIIKAIKNRKRPEYRLVDAFYPDPPPLAYGVNNEIPNVSSAVTLNYNEKYGRHLIANRDIDIGAVLVAEKAYCHIPTDKHKYDHCGTCCRLCFTLIPCDLCYTVMFCSITCKKIAYETFHKDECAVLCRLKKYEKYVIILHDSIYALAVRIISTVGLQNLQQYLDKIDNEKMPVTNEEKRNQGFTGDIFDSTNFETVFNLEHRIDDDKHVADKLFFRSVGSVLVTKCFNISPEDENYFKFAGLCLRLVSSLALNLPRVGELYAYYDNHTPTNESSTIDAVYPACKFVIHACDANTFKYQYGKSNIIRTMKPIKAGSLITGTAVASLGRTVEERRQLLRERYLIDCKCELCVKNISIKVNAPSKMIDQFDLLHGEALALFNLQLEDAFLTLRRNKDTFDARIKDLLKPRLNYLKRLCKKYQYDTLYLMVEAALVELCTLQGNLVVSVSHCADKTKLENEYGEMLH